MKFNFKYTLLILLSFVWLEDSIIKTYDAYNTLNKTFYNKNGDSRVNLINSDIEVTKLEFELERENRIIKTLESENSSKDKTERNN